MKGILGSIIGGILVLLVILLFPTQIDTAQEIITKQTTRHPCQQNEINVLELTNSLDKEKRYSQSETAIINYEWRELMKKSDECAKFAEEWMTEEFKKELKLLEDK